MFLDIFAKCGQTWSHHNHHFNSTIGRQPKIMSLIYYHHSVMDILWFPGEINFDPKLGRYSHSYPVDRGNSVHVWWPTGCDQTGWNINVVDCRISFCCWCWPDYVVWGSQYNMPKGLYKQTIQSYVGQFNYWWCDEILTKSCMDIIIVIMALFPTAVTFVDWWAGERNCWKLIQSTSLMETCDIFDTRSTSLSP